MMSLLVVVQVIAVKIEFAKLQYNKKLLGSNNDKLLITITIPEAITTLVQRFSSLE